MFSNNRRARVVDGHVVRDGESSSSSSIGGGFSPRRFVLIGIIAAVLVVTNPANEFDKLFQSLRQQVMGSGANNRSRKEDLSDWAWKKLLDPPLSVTNFGIFTLEERNTKMDISALQQVWSCNFYDQRTGAFCNALANQLCHEKPLLYDPQSLAYTAHRCICLLLIGSALLSFCCCGAIPSTIASEPILRAVLTSVCRSNVSLVLLALDLFNASSFVYPALVRMEKVIPTLGDGRIASSLGLPPYCDFVFYAIVLVIFVGGGSNALANNIYKQEPCYGFDSTVAAAVAYCHAFASSPLGAFDTKAAGLVSKWSLSTVFWGFLPVTALLGGSPSHVASWLFGGMFGFMLGQYHLDNQNWIMTAKNVFESTMNNILASVR